MRLRPTLALAVTAALLLAYYLTLEDGPAPEPPAEQALLPGFSPGAVRRIEIERPGDAAADPTPGAPGGAPAPAPVPAPAASGPLALAREGPGEPWRLVAPVEDAADQLVVRRLLDALAEAVRRDPRGGLGAADVGLAPPRLRVRLLGADPSAPAIALEVGSRDPSGRRAYVRVTGAGRLDEVDGALVDAVDLSAAIVREKRLFAADPAFVEGVRLQGPKVELRFRRDAPFWRIQSPIAAYADDQAVEALLGALAALHAERFVADAPADLARFGLDPARATVTLEQAGRDETVLLGDRADRPEEIYARRADAQAVVATSDAVTHRIGWDIERWRSRRLVHVRAQYVDAIHVRRPARGAEPARAARLARDRDRWRFTEPADVPADADAVARLLEGLLDCRYEAALPAPQNPGNFGLDRPLAVTIATRQRELLIEVGARSVSERCRYVRSSETGEVYEVALPDLDALEHAWPLLRDRHLVHLDPAAIVRFVVRGEGRPVRPFVRLPEGGFTTPGRAVRPEALGPFLAALARLTALDVLEPPDDLAHAGLAAPWLVVELVRARGDGAEGAEGALVLAIGRRLPDGPGYRARFEEPGSEPIYVSLAEATVAALEAELTAPPPPAPDAPAGAGEDGL